MHDPGLDDLPAAESVTVSTEVELHDTATDGRGVGRLPGGKVVFVEGGIGGEWVTVRLERETRSLAEGSLESVLKRSEMRQDPPCPPGCSLWQLPAATRDAPGPAHAQEALVDPDAPAGGRLVSGAGRPCGPAASVSPGKSPELSSEGPLAF